MFFIVEQLLFIFFIVQEFQTKTKNLINFQIRLLGKNGTAVFFLKNVERLNQPIIKSEKNKNWQYK